MNERIQELEVQCWEHDQSWTGVGHRVFNSKKFAELIYKDIITVVAAQALLNESALDVFKNLKNIYEGAEQ